MSDDEIWNLKRGGHDYRKVHAAYKAAIEHKGQPTVILANTIKGYGLGPSFEGRNATHQMKKLTLDDLKLFRDAQRIPITDEQLEADPYLPPYYHPGADAPEIQYLLERRARARRVRCRSGAPRPSPLVLPGDKVYEVLTQGLRQAGDRHHDGASSGWSATWSRTRRSASASCRSSRTRPARSAWTRSSRRQKIYNPHGQPYTAVDAQLMLAYKESEQGQILHEGIDEAGLDGVVHRRRHVLRHARRADDPDLHLLLDVRVPAHRRPVSGRPATR